MRAAREYGFYTPYRDGSSGIEPVSGKFEPVSGIAIWKSKFGEQRLARKMGLRKRKYTKFSMQRLAVIPLSRGNVGTILLT
jgi:hypothetical protein